MASDYEVTLRFLAETIEDKDKLWEIIWRVENIVKASDPSISACWVAADGVKEAEIVSAREAIGV